MTFPAGTKRVAFGADYLSAPLGFTNGIILQRNNGDGSTDAYPKTAGGVTAGLSSGSVAALGTSTGTSGDDLVHGYWTANNTDSNGGPFEVRVDLDAPGLFDVVLRLNHETLTQYEFHCAVYDGASTAPLFSVNLTGQNTSKVIDAHGNLWDAAAWRTSQVPQRVTFASSYARLLIGAHAGNYGTPISGLEIIPATPPTTAHTSVAAGDWKTGATWDTGTVPAAGDTVVVNHALTHDGSTPIDIGASGANGSVAATFNLGGTLTCTGAKLTLTYRGDIRVMGYSLTPRRVITVPTGVVDLLHDSSLATAPTTTRYLAGSADASAGATIHHGGATLTNRGRWRSATTNAALSGVIQSGINGTDGCSLGLELPYTDFSHLGDASTPWFWTRFYDNAAAHASRIDVRGSTFDVCGATHFESLGANADVLMAGATFTNSPGARNVDPVTISSHATGAGLRDFSGMVCDKSVSLQCMHGASLDGSRFLGGVENQDPALVWASAVGTVFRGTSSQSNSPMQGSWPGAAPLTDTLHWYAGDFDDAHVGGNISGVVSPVTNAFDGLTLWHDGNSGYAGNSPNGFLGPQNGSARLDFTLKRMLMLPRRNGGPGGNLYAFGAGGQNTYVTLEHNTPGEGESTLVQLNSADARLVSCKSNLGYRPNGDTGTFYVASMNNLAYDNSTGQMVTAAALDYNAVEGVTAGAAGKGYNVTLPSGSPAPGAHDVAITDAQFKWRRTMGAAAVVTPLAFVRAQAGNSALTDDQASALLLAKLAARDAAYDWRTVILPWLRDLWTPENPALIGAAHDGTTIGAVQPAAPVVASTPVPTLLAPVTLVVKDDSGNPVVGCLVKVESFDPKVAVPAYQTYITDSAGQITIQAESVAPGQTKFRAYALVKFVDFTVGVVNG